MPYDLNRVPENGKVILPLSMSRLHTGQNAQSIFDFAKFFIQKAPNLSIDFICVYTNGLYFNSNETAHTVRRRTTAQMLEHKRRLSSILKKQSTIPPQAFQFETLDNLILQDPNFIEKFAMVKKLYANDPVFQGLVDDMTITPGEAGVDFVLEEVLFTNDIRTKTINFRSFLSTLNSWQLICYPGKVVLPDVYLFQKELFEIRLLEVQNFQDNCTQAIYDCSRKLFINYNQQNYFLKMFKSSKNLVSA